MTRRRTKTLSDEELTALICAPVNFTLSREDKKEIRDARKRDPALFRKLRKLNDRELVKLFGDLLDVEIARLRASPAYGRSQEIQKRVASLERERAFAPVLGRLLERRKLAPAGLIDPGTRSGGVRGTDLELRGAPGPTPAPITAPVVSASPFPEVQPLEPNSAKPARPAAPSNVIEFRSRCRLYGKVFHAGQVNNNDVW